MQQSPQASGPTETNSARLFVGRLLETFFRRWVLYVLPLVLLLSLGVATVANRDESYQATGVILVNRDSLLNEITSVRGQNSFGFDTPATYTSRQLNTLLGTETFLKSVITASGLSTALGSGAITLESVRKSIWAAPQGDELVAINAASPNSELSYRLAGSAIDSYLQWQIDNNVAQSQSAEQFLESLLVPYQQRLDSARQALATYSNNHPVVGADVNRPPDEQVEIANLTEAVNRADDQLSTARASLASAQLASGQASTDVAQRLRIVDAPVQPTAPERHRRKDALTLMFFLTLGALVSGAALVVATLMDHSVRYDEEIEARLNVPVLANVPQSRGLIRTRVL